MMRILAKVNDRRALAGTLFRGKSQRGWLVAPGSVDRSLILSLKTA